MTAPQKNETESLKNQSTKIPSGTPMNSDLPKRDLYTLKIWDVENHEEFFLYGLTPVMFLVQVNGRGIVKAFDIDRLEFEIDNSLRAEIWHDRSNLVQRLTKAEFFDAVQAYGISVETIEAAMKT